MNNVRSEKKKTSTIQRVITLVVFFFVMCCLCFGFFLVLGSITPIKPTATLPVISSSPKAQSILTASARPGSSATFIVALTSTLEPSVTPLQPATRRPTINIEASQTLIASLTPTDIVDQPTRVGNCNPAYPDVCITHDQTCAELKAQGIYNFRVLPPDPYNKDRDNDGVGCEN